MKENYKTIPAEALEKIREAQEKLLEALEMMEGGEPWKYNHICTAEQTLREVLEDGGEN